jgi:peptidyl-prolyl cis-trans isomerase D
LAKLDFSEKNDKAYGQMVYQDYNTIADSTVKVSEAELKAYYEAHKEEYRQKAGRSIEYVMWSIQPSGADSAEARKDIDKIVGEFRSTTDDSTFLVANSDAPFSEQFRKKDELGTMYADSLSRAPVGVVVGPAFEGEQIRYYKKLGSAMRADSIKASHILLQPKTGEKMEDAMKRADSLKAVVMAGGDFAALARTMSKDSASAVKGGDLGTFPYEMMVPTFSKVAFATPAGQYVTVETRFGAHLIRVDENKMDQQKYLIGVLGKNFDVSKETQDEIFGKAGAFASKHRTAGEFNKGIETDKLMKREAQNFKESDRSIPGFSNARDLIRWAYEAEPGAVSSPITLDNDKVIVALLIESHEDGISPLASVRKRVEADALKSKKGDILVASLKKKAAGLKTVAEIGVKLNLPVMPLQDVTFGGGYIPGLGREPKVLGALFGMAKGKVSEPVKGDRGVYILQLERIDAGPVPADLKPYAQQIAMQYTMQLDNQALQALQEASEIVDNRYLFY